MLDAKLFEHTCQLAHELAQRLEQHAKKIVFAESCTAGLASAVLAQVPGISSWLCGSAVTYQETCKQDWLHVSPSLIQQVTAVSEPVTREMALAVLRQTTAADFSIGITGHLESQSTTEATHMFVATAYREVDQVICLEPTYHQLSQATRLNRQWEAAQHALRMAIQHLS